MTMVTEEQEYIDKTSFRALLKRLTLPFCSNFVKGCLFKIILDVVAKRGVMWLIRGPIPVQIPRFGMSIAVMGLVFHVVLCILRKMAKK